MACAYAGWQRCAENKRLVVQSGGRLQPLTMPSIKRNQTLRMCWSSKQSWSLDMNYEFVRTEEASLVQTEDAVQPLHESASQHSTAQHSIAYFCAAQQ